MLSVHLFNMYISCTCMLFCSHEYAIYFLGQYPPILFHLLLFSRPRVSAVLPSPSNPPVATAFLLQLWRQQRGERRSTKLRFPYLQKNCKRVLWATFWQQPTQSHCLWWARPRNGLAGGGWSLHCLIILSR